MLTTTLKLGCFLAAQDECIPDEQSTPITNGKEHPINNANRISYEDKIIKTSNGRNRKISTLQHSSDESRYSGNTKPSTPYSNGVKGYATYYNSNIRTSANSRNTRKQNNQTPRHSKGVYSNGFTNVDNMSERQSTNARVSVIDPAINKERARNKNMMNQNNFVTQCVSTCNNNLYAKFYHAPRRSDVFDKAVKMLSETGLAPIARFDDDDDDNDDVFPRNKSEDKITQTQNQGTVKSANVVSQSADTPMTPCLAPRRHDDTVSNSRPSSRLSVSIVSVDLDRCLLSYLTSLEIIGHNHFFAG